MLGMADEIEDRMQKRFKSERMVMQARFERDRTKADEKWEKNKARWAKRTDSSGMGRGEGAVYEGESARL